jgi:hypothetical protein
MEKDLVIGKASQVHGGGQKVTFKNFAAVEFAAIMDVLSISKLIIGDQNIHAVFEDQLSFKTFKATNNREYNKALSALPNIKVPEGATW